MLYVDIENLKPHKDNPRIISHRQIIKLSESLKNNPEYFEARPIIVDKDMIIWAGNSRYKAAKYLGLEKVPVHVMDLPEEKMREIMIRDNINNGEWDTSILATDWDVDLLVDFGIEFKTSTSKEEDTDISSDDGKKKKKVKTKKLATCPHCNKDFEL